MLLLLMLPLSVVIAADGYKGKTFWVAYLQSDVGKNPFEISVHITSEFNTTVKVKLAGVSADSRGEKDWEQTYSVTRGSVTNIIIPEEYTFKAKSGKSTNKALYIEAADDIMVVAKNSSGASSDATVVIPVKSLGSEYYVMQYSVVQKNYPSQYLILATEDSSVIEIKNNDKNSDKQPNNSVYTRLLHKGEYHIVQSEKDLTGSWIHEKNGKKIAVFCGNTCAYVPRTCQSCDHLFEQVLPVESWGHEFAVVPFDGRDKYVVRIMAKTDDTWVDIDGERRTIPKAGKFIEVELTEPVYIVSSYDVMVCQYTIGTRCDYNEGDPSVVMVKPIFGYSGITELPVMETEHITRYYATVLLKTQDLDKLTVNGKSLISSYKTIPYRSSYAYAHIELNQSSNAIKCDCNYNFFSYGFGWYESYAY